MTGIIVQAFYQGNQFINLRNFKNTDNFKMAYP